MLENLKNSFLIQFSLISQRYLTNNDQTISHFYSRSRFTKLF